MGAGSSASKYELAREKRRQQALNGSYTNTDEQNSDLYKCTKCGDIEGMKRILKEKEPDRYRRWQMREPNGDTAIHAAVRSRNIEAVEVLIQNDYPRNVYDRNGKYPYELVETNSMRKLFERTTDSNRFVEDYTPSVSVIFDPQANSKSRILSNSDSQDETQNSKKATFFHQFESREEIEEYSLNHQTMAMWLQIYQRVLHRFRNTVQHDFLRADALDLKNNHDFKHFISKQCDETQAARTQAAINEAAKENKIKPLIKMYTDEKACYKQLNRQLANPTNEHDFTPHLCDRLIMEFHMRSHELEDYKYTGITYRGTCMTEEDLESYKRVARRNNGGIISFRAFTSSSRDKNIAFGFTKETDLHGKIVILFVINVNHASTFIIGIEDISEYQYEQEVLILPGTLFQVTDVEDDCCEKLNDGKEIVYTAIHLNYLHIPVSTWKKIRHTYRSSKNRVV